jgi:acetylornithine deacetylase/succinyl-diaminopimelate desuccinylase-like protein
MAMNKPRISSGALQRVLDRLDREGSAALERLFRLLAIPSVSTDPVNHESCIEAAECCADALREIGFEARVEATLGKPLVVGHWRARAA